MSEHLIVIAIALATLLGAEALYYAAMYSGQRRRRELKRRLRAVATPGSDLSLLRERRIARTPGVERFLSSFDFARRLERLLLQTDLTWTVATFLSASLVLALGFVILLSLVFPAGSLAALWGVPVGALLPLVVVFRARAQRSRKVSEQLPDALDMMVRSLRAGHGIGAGFKLVASEMPPPIAVELGRCFEEQSAGVDLRESIRHMTDRVPGNLDLRIFAVSLVIQHETGGNLVEILEKIAHTIRERFKFYGKLRALTVEAKMSGIILSALPILCGAFIFATRPKFVQPLFNDPLGRLMLLGGIMLWVTGIFWMRRLARVDY